MRNLLYFFILFFPAVIFGQVVKTAAVPYTKGAGYTPNIASSSELRVDTAASALYWWDRDALTWMRFRPGVDVITGSSAPAYTPRDNQSLFAVNASSELYYYNSPSWVQIGGSGGGGIYGGSGNVPDATVATLIEDFEFAGGDTTSFTLSTGTTNGGQLFSNLAGISVIHRDTASNYLEFNNAGAGFTFGGTFDRLTITGRDARYAADYSGTFSQRSLVDKAYVDGVIPNIVATNGLTESPANTIALGGTLSGATAIAAGANTLSVTTSTASANPVSITSTTGNSLNVTATTGICVNASATGGNATGVFNKHASSTTGVGVPFQITRSSTGTTTAGVANAFDFYIQNGSGALPNCTRLVSTLTTVTNGAEVSSFGINLQSAGALTQRFLVAGTGQTTLSGYGDNTFAGTPTRIAGWDTDGNFVEISPSAYSSSSDWTTAYSSATQSTSSWTATNAASNINAAIVPKGTGGVIAAVPDGTATGGNSRGNYAVDLQTQRTNNTDVASGANSTIPGGRRCTASGQYSFATGFRATASGAGSVCFGGSGSFSVGATATGDNSFAFGTGADATATNAIAMNGDASAQSAVSINSSYANGADKYGMVAIGGMSHLNLFEVTLGTGAQELFLDGSALRATIPADRAWVCEVRVLARVSTVGNGTVAASDIYAATYKCVIANKGGTTALVGTVQADMAAQFDANMATATFTIAADDANDALAITYNPGALEGTTTQTNVYATIWINEF
jgi:hypothetical protein